MKKNLTIVLILLQTLSSFGQFAGRKFVFQNERLVFINDSLLDFTFMSNGCLDRTLRGIGKYKINDNHIMIQTSTQDTLPTYKIEQKEIINSSDSTTVYFKFSKSLGPIGQTQIFFLDSTYKYFAEGRTDKSGMITIKNDQRIKYLNCYDYNGGEVIVPFRKLIGTKSIVIVTSYRLLGISELLFNLEDSSSSICLTGPLPLPKDRKTHAQWKRRMYLNMLTHSWPWNWHFRPNHLHDPKRHCLIETNN